MKIVYVITKSNWGGAQRHVFDLATTMKDKGHDVWVAVGGEGVLKQKLEKAGIYTFSIAALDRDISLAKDIGSFREIFSIVRSKRPDILHLHSPKAAGLGSLAGRLLRVKSIITTVHGWTFNESRPFYERLAIIFASWLTMLFSHTTILLSEREFTQAFRFPGAKDKIKLIPLGISAPTFMSIEGAKNFMAKAIGIPAAEFNKKTVIGCIAELHANKGLCYLVEAMASVAAQNPEAIAVVVGEGEEAESLRNKIKEHKVERSVFLIGYVDGAAEYLKAFSMLVLPSIKEGLPYAVFEAGSAGLPVIATTVGGIPEIIEDMKSGILIQPKKSRELGHAISFMIEHPVDRKKYGAALKERIRSKFSEEKMLWLLLGLYGERPGDAEVAARELD
ncbi:MAG: hypothetical protein QOG91_254 [Candidatus Parcubacteria bacterium]|jgi:glycosyltransferase involved in cell wall biosynthesis|nr:hypothetical protein [Candidatus Parcubacteria bacterium]